MAKDSRLTFRISSDVKRELEVVAETEGRSVAQVSEAFLRAGLERYHRSGSKSLQPHVRASERGNKDRLRANNE